jgi:hypothetical protein
LRSGEIKTEEKIMLTRNLGLRVLVFNQLAKHLPSAFRLLNRFNRLNYYTPVSIRPKLITRLSNQSATFPSTLMLLSQLNSHTSATSATIIPHFITKFSDPNQKKNSNDGNSKKDGKNIVGMLAVGTAILGLYNVASMLADEFRSHKKIEMDANLEWVDQIDWVYHHIEKTGATKDDKIWCEILQRHFPHVREDITYGEHEGYYVGQVINYRSFVIDAFYEKDYKGFSMADRKLFSAVKQGLDITKQLGYLNTLNANDLKLALKLCDKNGCNALMWAIIADNQAAVTQLISAGAELKSNDTVGIMFAYERSHYPLLRKLLSLATPELKQGLFRIRPEMEPYSKSQNEEPRKIPLCKY